LFNEWKVCFGKEKLNLGGREAGIREREYKIRNRMGKKKATGKD
jgi:hypothetical protein